MIRVTVQERFWAKVRVDASGCWLWTGAVNDRGYGCISVSGRVIRAHRVAWLLTHFIIPDDLHVLHHCDNPPCVNPAHLFLGTRSDNMRDMATKGRGRNGDTRGVGNGSAKLTEADIAGIRRAYAGRRTQGEIAREYGVARETIGDVVRGNTWRHVRTEEA